MLDEDSACSVFFKHSTCYDVLPESGKLLVLDSTLPVSKTLISLKHLKTVIESE